MTSHRTTTWSLVAALGGGVLLMPTSASAGDPQPGAAQRELLDKYCLTCHNYTDNAGGLEFEIYDP